MNDPAPLVVIPVRLPQDYGRLDEFRSAIADDGVGGILLFGGDLDLTPRFIARLREAAPADLLVMSDVERGIGQQFDGGLRLPPAMAVGALRDPSAAYKLGAATAVGCRRVGIDMALAPVLDLYVEPRNPIVGTRAFAEDAELVARLGAAWIEGCQDEGVAACAKHFPGHGRTLVDSHAALPVVDTPAETLRATDVLPFARAVRARVDAVMTAHVAYPGLDPDGPPDLPATLSKRVIGGLLRTGLGFEGLVITDALIMEGVRGRRGEEAAAVMAIAAGCDLLLCPTDHRAIIAAVRTAVDDGVLATGRIAASLGRREAVLRRSGGRTAREEEEMDEYRAYAMAVAAVTTLADEDRRLPLAEMDPKDVLAVVLDDDDRPGREEPLLDRAEQFGRGVLRRSPKEGDDRLILGQAAVAERVLVCIYGDIRAWKERAGLHPDLSALLGRLREKAGDRLIEVVFGAPTLAGFEPPGAPRGTVVCAWDDAPSLQRAALDLLLDGRAPTGRVPWGPDPLA